MKTLDLFSFKNKRIAVLGGEGMLGKICKETITDLEGEALSFDIKAGATYVCDIVADYQALYELAHSCSFDGVINCVVGNQRPVNSPEMGWDNDLAAGLTAAVNIHRAFYDALREAGGAVLNIGSDLSLKAPDPHRYAPKYKPLSYSVVKHGIIGMTRYYAALWGEHGIRVNCLCPGSLDDEQRIPDCALRRLAQPHEMKGAIAWLMSDASSYVTGAIISVDGGSTL